METHFKVLFILNLLKIWAAFQPEGLVQTEDFNEILIVFSEFCATVWIENYLWIIIMYCGPIFFANIQFHKFSIDTYFPDIFFQFQNKIIRICGS